ncbi:MAG: hypothetical protein BWZ10_02280 [candidate division BRC1 bacterium ADurb.BinA364]|nr:MAG: hypothetical protein BWZ10_02280 [candidate division BRC1 bacterium ADurb.BinA364]
MLRPWHERAGDVFIFSPDPMTRAETRRRLAALDSPGAREAVAEFWSDSAHLCAWADSTAADWLAGAGGGAAPLLKTIAPLFAASPGTISASMRFSQDGARASVEWRRSAPSGAPASNAPVSFDTQAARAAPASASGLVEFALHDAGDAWRRIWPRLSGPQGWLAGGRARLDARWAALGLAIGELAQALDGHLALAAGGEPECPMYALLSLGVADRPLADQALEQRLAPAMAAFGSLGRATHRGVAYRLLTPPGAGRSMAWGFAGGRLLWASDEKALRRAIDSSLGAPALASRDSFQAVVRQASPAGASGFFFLDPNRAIGALSPLGPLAAQQLGIPPAAAREWMLRMPNPEAIAPLFPAAGGVWTATERGWKADAFDGGGLAAHLGLAAPMLAGAWAPEPGRARTRAMLAAVDEDFLRIGQALERYRVDQGKYPMPTRVSPPGSVLAPDSRPRWMLPPAGSALALHDPFAPESGVSYGYFANEAGWILFSAGPDNKYDIRPDEDFIPERGGAWPPLYWKTYDPTNGAASAGDIWMTAH